MNPISRFNALIRSLLTLRRFFCCASLALLSTMSVAAAALDNWHVRDTPLLPAHLFRVAFGNGIFVAVGSGDTILRSTNGVVWSRHPAPLEMELEQGGFPLSFLDGRFFVALEEDFGEGPVLFTSTNGLQWTKHDEAAPRRMAFGNGVFVGLGDNSLRYSTNGIQWTTAVSEGDFSPAAVAFGGGQFVVVGHQYFNEFGTLSVVLTSTDGLGWTYTRIEEDEEFYNLAFGNGRFVSEGYFGYSGEGADTNILASSDAITWTRHVRPADLSYDYSVLHFGGGFFVAAAINNLDNVPAVVSSVDGIDWEVHSLYTNYTYSSGIYSLAFGHNTFVGVGEYSMLVQSDPLTNAPPAEPATLALRQYPGLTITGTVGKTYAIEATTDVSQTNGWQNVTNLTLSSSPAIWVDLQSTGTVKRFYRAVAQ
jgi:hypothetical protein